MSVNPFFGQSTLPYELPPFAEIREAHYAPAIERGMALQLDEVAAIAGSPSPPDYSNTLLALERSGAVLRRVLRVFFHQTGSDTTPGVQALQTAFSPRLAAHNDAIRLNAALFGRVKAVYDSRSSLDAVSARLAERYYADFVRAGALLDAPSPARLES